MRTIGIVLIALMVCTALLAVLIVTTRSLTVIEEQPTDYLPASETIAIFFNANKEILRSFETEFPTLGNITLPPPKAVALIRFENQIVLVEFRDALTKNQESATILGRFSITLTDPEAITLLTNETQRLSSLRTFSALASQKKPTDAWAFFYL